MSRDRRDIIAYMYKDTEANIRAKVLNQVKEILDATTDINYNVHELRAFIRGELK